MSYNWETLQAPKPTAALKTYQKLVKLLKDSSVFAKLNDDTNEFRELKELLLQFETAGRGSLKSKSITSPSKRKQATLERKKKSYKSGGIFYVSKETGTCCPTYLRMETTMSSICP